MFSLDRPRLFKILDGFSLVLISILLIMAFSSGCGMTEEDINCGNSEACWERAKQKWPRERDKAYADIEAEWARFDEKWSASKNKHETNGKCRQGEYSEYSKECEEKSPADPSQEEVENTRQDPEQPKNLKKGLTMAQTLAIVGEPLEHAKRAGEGEIWRFYLDSAICGDKLTYCTIYFDGYNKLDFTMNVKEHFWGEDRNGML